MSLTQLIVVGYEFCLNLLFFCGRCLLFSCGGENPNLPVNFNQYSFTIWVGGFSKMNY